MVTFKINCLKITVEVKHFKRLLREQIASLEIILSEII